MTKKGYAKKMPVDEIRAMGRNAKGLRMIKLNDGDEVIGMQVVEDEQIMGIEVGGTRIEQTETPKETPQA